MAAKRLLKIALVGAPNAGKSTLLNRLVMSDVSCTSNKVHTTRKNFLAAYTEADTQLEFYDSPGLVTREHLLKHRLEESLVTDPNEAAQKCDLIAVVVDVSNPRDRRKLNKGILRMLHDHSEKRSFLIMNKIDLIKEKRQLLDIGLRLTEGCLGNKVVSRDPIIRDLLKRNSHQQIKSPSKYVIYLDNYQPDETSPDHFEYGYKNFERIFSISAKEDDGVDELRESFMQLAVPVEQWPHGEAFVCSKDSKDVVQSIIRGKVMDYTEQQVPYVVKYNYRQYQFDELGSLFVDLELKLPNKYMVGKVLGQQGATIFKIINESRDKIANVLGCDVKLGIEVSSKEK